ncbi:hypothetical protein [Psittacicella hinzii]|uniref:Uncharacterized protein n=1 Tax=Psittacicella hinzii TaxID=2028575 RepID=A0A3A1YAN1_9GAMM|nr:hypothetical protein [Psittacicella hinzii]RIY34396.1 hypothetical protein CKF58_08215 [Psittacicella hinzii]
MLRFPKKLESSAKLALKYIKEQGNISAACKQYNITRYRVMQFAKLTGVYKALFRKRITVVKRDKQLLNHVVYVFYRVD